MTTFAGRVAVPRHTCQRGCERLRVPEEAPFMTRRLLSLVVVGCRWMSMDVVGCRWRLSVVRRLLFVVDVCRLLRLQGCNASPLRHNFSSLSPAFLRPLLLVSPSPANDVKLFPCNQPTNHPTPGIPRPCQPLAVTLAAVMPSWLPLQMPARLHTRGSEVFSHSLSRFSLPVVFHCRLLTTILSLSYGVDQQLGCGKK